MTCKRCEDVHEAQKNGKTQEACKCKCHDKVGNTDDTMIWNDGTGTLHFNTLTTATADTLNTGTATTFTTSPTTTFDISGNQLNITTSLDVCTCAQTGIVNTCPIHIDRNTNIHQRG